MRCQTYRSSMRQQCPNDATEGAIVCAECQKHFPPGYPRMVEGVGGTSVMVKDAEMEKAVTDAVGILGRLHDKVSCP